jgi:head-tail adaptor
MKAGQLRCRIAFQSPAPTQNARGAESIAWLDWPIVHASITTTAGSERHAIDQIVPVADHIVEVRQPLPAPPAGQPPLDTSCRLRWLRGGQQPDQFFGIVAIADPDGRQRRLILQCSELVGEDRVI